MTNRIHSSETHVKLAIPELPAGIRSGGEMRPLDYPHLYQIQAGDWRISYAVEHNRLAILVLEVLGAEGESSKDPKSETLKQKMKIKLLDWPEGSGSSQLPPEEISKKLKIRWMDLAEESGESRTEEGHGTSRIKLKGGTEPKAAAQKPAGKHRITLLESGEQVIEDDSDAASPEGNEGEDERKVTPLDEPTM
jgi:hypothetical protein